MNLSCSQGWSIEWSSLRLCYLYSSQGKLFSLAPRYMILSHLGSDLCFWSVNWAICGVCVVSSWGFMSSVSHLQSEERRELFCLRQSLIHWIIRKEPRFAKSKIQLKSRSTGWITHSWFCWGAGLILSGTCFCTFDYKCRSGTRFMKPLKISTLSWLNSGKFSSGKFLLSCKLYWCV